MTKLNKILLTGLVILVAALTLLSPVLADENKNENEQEQENNSASTQKMPKFKGGREIFGTVATVSGNTITVTSQVGPNKTSTTYTVDAANAVVTKNGATSTVSAIAVGDRVMIQGIINGTSVTANKIRDGLGQKEKEAGDLSVIEGNGQPVVAGTVSSISGNTITLTNKSNVTYTIDATSAKVVKDGALSTVSAIATGDKLVVQGTVNGTNIVASSIIDQKAPAQNSVENEGNKNKPKGIRGFFFNVGGFFRKLFGF